MKIFVFGAGASLGSQIGKGFSDWEKSPLINNLFDKVYADEYPSRLLSASDLEDAKDTIKSRNLTLEEWLTKRWEDIAIIPRKAKRRSERAYFGALIFYMWNLFQGVSKTYDSNNVYNKLLKDLKGKDVKFGLISFNYDTLLDRAYSQVFVKSLRSIEDYEEIGLVKPHGSVNWFLEMRPSDNKIDRVREGGVIDIDARILLASEKFFNGSPLDISNLYIEDPSHSSLDSITAVFRKFDNQYCYPLIFAPLSGKAYDVVENFERRVLARGQDIMSKATDVYLIGYSANDETINDLLSYCNPETKLHTIGNGSAREISDRVRRKNTVLEKGRIFDNGFEVFVDQIGLFEY